MLVLTRKPGQALLIGDTIEIYVAEIRGDVVRLSIKAPREVSILRREVLDAIRQENAAAAAADPALFETFTLEIPTPENRPSAVILPPADPEEVASGG